MNAHENENYPFSHPLKKKTFFLRLDLVAFFRFFFFHEISLRNGFIRTLIFVKNRR
jgi:hypothetical protein